MTLITDTPIDTLQITYTFPAPPEKVFRFWVEPEKIKQWMGGAQTNVLSVESDLSVGGQYTITIATPDGGETHIRGKYLEIISPKRLVYTWAMEAAGMETDATTVTVEFTEKDSSTEVLLTHNPFTAEPMRQQHIEGWFACISAITDLL